MNLFQSEVSPVKSNPYLHLSAAVLAQACRDIQKNGENAQEAAQWLAGDEAAMYLDAIGVDRNKVFDWLDKWADEKAQVRQ